MDSYEGTDVADIVSDGIPEFIMQKRLRSGFHTKSLFWKRDNISDVEGENNSLPKELNLYLNYPNPFNPSTTITFALPFEAKVNIKVHNIFGKEITELLNETRINGEYEIIWDGRASKGNQMPSNIYFITMIADKFSKTTKTMLIK